MKKLALGLAIGLMLLGAAALSAPEVLAQTATTTEVVNLPNDDQVVIPWGEWVGAAAMFLAASAAALIAYGFRFLPAEWAAMAKTARVDQLLERAIQYGANTVKGATKDQVMTVPVANDVVEGALEYAVNHGPKSILGWVGGEEGLRQKIIARLDIAKDEAIPG